MDKKLIEAVCSYPAEIIGRTLPAVSRDVVIALLDGIWMNDEEGIILMQTFSKAVSNSPGDSAEVAVCTAMCALERLFVVVGYISDDYNGRCAEYDELHDYIDQAKAITSEREIFNTLEQLRNRVVHYGSMDIRAFNGTQGVSALNTARFILYSLALYLQALTSSSPIRLGFKDKAAILFHDIIRWVIRMLSPLYWVIRFACNLCKKIADESLYGVRLTMRFGFTVLGIAFFIAIVTLIIGVAVYFIRDEPQYNDLSESDVVRLIGNASNMQRSKAMKLRFLTLQNLGKDFRIGDTPLDHTDSVTVSLYHSAVAEGWPDKNLFADYYYHVKDRFKLSFMPDLHCHGEFKYLLASERDNASDTTRASVSDNAPKNRKIEQTEFERAYVTSLNSELKLSNEKALITAIEKINHSDHLRMLVVIGDLSKLAQANHLTKSEMKMARNRIKDVIENQILIQLGLDKRKIEWAEENTADDFITFYVTEKRK